MKCPNCKGKTRVVFTFHTEDGGVKRTHKCDSCPIQFKSAEALIKGSIKHIKPEVGEEKPKAPLPEGMVGFIKPRTRKTKADKVLVVSGGTFITRTDLQEIDRKKKEARHAIEDRKMQRENDD